MAFLKIAHASAPGFARCGRVDVASIGIPLGLARARGVSVGEIEARDVRGSLPRPGPLDHKSRRGHVLVVAGSPGKRGAGRMSAWAALRGGAGLVTLAAAGATREHAADPIMSADLDAAGPDPGDRLVELAASARAVAMGPGMATGPEGQGLVVSALDRLEVPLVLDADALNHLGTDLARVAEASAPAVLTPHPGEAARMLGITPAEVEGDRIAAVRELAEKSRSVVVLKGARTLVCDGLADDSFVSINPTGGPALATAGSGDVLTGLIAALIAQGVPLAEAARLGVYLHGGAGERACGALGVWSVTATDVTEALPAAFVELGGLRQTDNAGRVRAATARGEI